MAVATESREWVVIESLGKKLFGVIHRPMECESAPLVISMHGFASTKCGTNRSYVYLADALAKAGIATLRFDFSGSGDSEGVLSEITFEDLVEDAKNVYQFVDQIEGIDPSRVGVFGASLGGTLAVLSSAERPVAKAMALWAPVASGELWYRDFIAQKPELLKADPKEVLSSFRGIKIHPQFQEQFGKMVAASALERLPSIPLLHMHGESDETVSLLHQQVYKMHAGGREGPTRFLTYPETAHSFGQARPFSEILKEIVTWFSMHL